MHSIQIKDITIGFGQPLALIAGPCVIESEALVLKTAEAIKTIAERLHIPFIFKSSYIKANRQSITSFTGPGLEEGLKILQKVKTQVGVPVLTDIHAPEEAQPAAQVADVLQIPAFLCRQTNLIVAAAKTGKPLNIKKGQFMAPEDMAPIAQKAVASGNEQVLLTERGATFGYHNLVVDFRSLKIMQDLGFPVVYDVTHSLQLPGAGGGVSGGQPRFIFPMARAAAAAGCQALFIETHPNVAEALSDAATMLPLQKLETLLRQIKAIEETVKTFGNE